MPHASRSRNFGDIKGAERNCSPLREQKHLAEPRTLKHIWMHSFIFLNRNHNFNFCGGKFNPTAIKRCPEARKAFISHCEGNAFTIIGSYDNLVFSIRELLYTIYLSISPPTQKKKRMYISQSILNIQLLLKNTYICSYIKLSLRSPSSTKNYMLPQFPLSFIECYKL